MPNRTIKMRRTGKTTRAIDEAVQKLFTFGEVRIYSQGTKKEEINFDMFITDPDTKVVGSYKIDRDLLEKLKRRLDLEHPNLKVIKGANFIKLRK